MPLSSLRSMKWMYSLRICNIKAFIQYGIHLNEDLSKGFRSKIIADIAISHHLCDFQLSLHRTCVVQICKPPTGRCRGGSSCASDYVRHPVLLNVTTNSKTERFNFKLKSRAECAPVQLSALSNFPLGVTTLCGGGAQVSVNSSLLTFLNGLD